jgi:hypothetical protein
MMNASTGSQKLPKIPLSFPAAPALSKALIASGKHLSTYGLGDENTGLMDFTEANLH